MLQLVDESLCLLSHSSFTRPAFAMNLQATVQPTITPVLLFHAVSDLIDNIYIVIDDCFFMYCPGQQIPITELWHKSKLSVQRKIPWGISVCEYTICTFILMSRPCFSSSFFISWAPKQARFSTKCFHSIGWKTCGSWGTYKPIFTW